MDSMDYMAWMRSTDSACRTCRLCLASDPQVRSIFEQEPALVGRVRECAEVEIRSDDGLPCGLCAPCREELDRSHAFRVRCKEADALLRRLRPIKLETERDPLMSPPSPPSPPSPCPSTPSPPPVHCELLEEPEIKTEPKAETEDPPPAPPKKTKSGRFECDTCSRPLSSLHSLRHHKKKAHGADNLYSKYATGWGKDLRYNCTDCPYVTPRRRNLVAHLRAHTGKKQFECDLCRKSFTSNEYLKNHMNLHSNEKSYTCPDCDKVFVNRFSFKKHAREHRAKVDSTRKMFVCDLCLKSFTTKRYMIEHLHRHNSVKNFVCEVCSARFVSNYELKRHNLIHGGKNLECDTCGSKFTHRTSLEKHMLRHVGKQPYLCYQCGAKFVYKQSYDKHIFRHTGARLFPCDECEWSCYSKYDLKRHKHYKHSKDKERKK